MYELSMQKMLLHIIDSVMPSGLYQNQSGRRGLWLTLCLCLNLQPFTAHPISKLSIRW